MSCYFLYLKFLHFFYCGINWILQNHYILHTDFMQSIRTGKCFFGMNQNKMNILPSIISHINWHYRAKEVQ